MARWKRKGGVRAHVDVQKHGLRIEKCSREVSGSVLHTMKGRKSSPSLRNSRRKGGKKEGREGRDGRLNAARSSSDSKGLPNPNGTAAGHHLFVFVDFSRFSEL